MNRLLSFFSGVGGAAGTGHSDKRHNPYFLQCGITDYYQLQTHPLRHSISSTLSPISPANAETNARFARTTVDNKNTHTIFIITSGSLCPGKYPKMPSSMTVSQLIAAAVNSGCDGHSGLAVLSVHSTLSITGLKRTRSSLNRAGRTQAVILIQNHPSPLQYVFIRISQHIHSHVFKFLYRLISQPLYVGCIQTI